MHSKGFLYQFDKTLIEVLRNPNNQVGIERRQDVDYQNFVSRVKHRETQEYKDYKINKPVQKLIEMFKADQTQRFCLYCHFKDRDPFNWILKLTEVCSTLGLYINRGAALHADVSRRVPIEAEGMDIDGVEICILLHVVGSFMNELEIFRVDLNNVRVLPQPEPLKLINLDN